MRKNNLITFCIFVMLLVFTVIQPALAIPTNATVKTSNSILPSTNQTLHKPVSKAMQQKVAVSKDPCPCIVFRLDDIQQFYLSDVQMKIMDVFQKENASLSIGIIGYDLPLDVKLVSYLKNNLKPGHAPIDIANHGWKHEDFSSLSLSQQVLLMNKTNQELAKIFGKKPHMFITPFNLYNNDTLKAIKQTKMSAISSGIWDNAKFVTTRGKIVVNKDSLGLYHVPAMTDFQVDIGNETYWTNIPKDKVIASIDSHISKYGYDVVLLHPQNFAVYVNGQYANTVDKKYIAELTNIIDYAKSKHIKIVTLSDIAGLDHKNTPAIKKISKLTTISTAKPTTVSKSMTIPILLPPKIPQSTKIASSVVEPNGSLTMNVKYLSGDRVGAYDVSLQVYRDFDTSPYKEISTISANPYVITSLPMYHQYKIKTFVGGMLSSTNLVTLDNPEQDLDVNIPDGGSMSVSVYYNDGQTPIPDVSVSVRSQDNKTRDTGVTDPDGIAPRFYLPSTIVYGDSYVVDAKINNHLTFSSNPIILPSGNANNVRLIAPWPSVIQSLITIKVYNQTTLLTTSGQSYAVDMYDDKGNQLVESPINIHGEGYFWSVKTGDYVFKVVNTNSGEVLGDLVVTLDGSKNNFDLIIQKHLAATKGDLGKEL